MLVSMITPAAQEFPSPPTIVDPESRSDLKRGTAIRQNGDITGDPRKQADPNMPNIPLQSPATVNSNQNAHQDSDPHEHKASRPNEKEDPAKNDLGQSATGGSGPAGFKTTAVADLPKNSDSAGEAPDQVPQRILTTIAGQGIPAAPSSVEIAGASI